MRKYGISIGVSWPKTRNTQFLGSGWVLEVLRVLHTLPGTPWWGRTRWTQRPTCPWRTRRRGASGRHGSQNCSRRQTEIPNFPEYWLGAANQMRNIFLSTWFVAFCDKLCSSLSVENEKFGGVRPAWITELLSSANRNPKLPRILPWGWKLNEKYLFEH